jgi:hypothetical protein
MLKFINKKILFSSYNLHYEFKKFKVNAIASSRIGLEGVFDGQGEK